MNVIKILKACYIRTGDFKGRSGRKEFWTFYIYLYSVIALSIYLTMNVNENFVILIFIFPILNIFTGLALTFRRLHDLNLSAWILIIPAIINGIGSITETPALNLMVLVGMSILYLMPGTKIKNNYGKVHKI